MRHINTTREEELELATIDRQDIESKTRRHGLPYDDKNTVGGGGGGSGHTAGGVGIAAAADDGITGESKSGA